MKNEIFRRIQGFAEKNAGNKAKIGVITWETKLLGGPLLDSISFISLLAELEEGYGIELDLVEYPIEEFIVVGPLIEKIVEQLSES